ncbi:AMP-binding protein [Providencia alcalifaciens]|nr:AMP-binding protein [Providencia alcalifaciens]
MSITTMKTCMNDTSTLSLEQLVEFARQHSLYYARHYQQVPKHGWQLCDLPLIEPANYWAESHELTRWSVLTAPFTDGFAFKTAGTSGACKLSLYTHSEWHTFVNSFSRSLSAQLQSGDRVGNLFFAGDLYSSFLFIHQALSHVDVPICVYPFTGSIEPQSLFDQISQYKINVLAGVPATLLRLAAKAEEQHKQLFEISLILFGGESLFAEQLLLLKRIFPHARIASIGCAGVDSGLIGQSDPQCHVGEHRVFEPESIVEIIDEMTGEPIKDENRTGMLVVTNLTRKLMPLIRYPVGDIAAWSEPMGKPARKFILHGRSSFGHRIRVGISTIYPDDIDMLITEKLGRQQWQIILTHDEHSNQLTLRIAFSGNKTHSDMLFNIIQREGHKSESLHWIIEWCKPDELICSTRTGKLQRIIDRRTYVTKKSRR